MGTRTVSQVDKFIEFLVQSINKQQEQLNFLLEERKMLEDRIKTQHEKWVSGLRLYEDQMLQMKDFLVEKDMACSLEATKSDLLIGLKHREASLLELKLEQTEDELVDFKASFDYLSKLKNSEETGNEKEKARPGDFKSSASKILDNEIKKLKLEYEKLSLEKNSEISALLKEKSFVWNQYSVLESNLTDKLKSKQAEIDQANNKIVEVLASVEQLQSSNNEKDEMIASLKSKLAEVEVGRDKLKEELSRFTQELESMRKSRTAQVSPSLKHGSAAQEPLSKGAKSDIGKENDIVVKKELSSGKAAVSLKDEEKGSRTLKRKAVEAISVPETPKLFSSAFKVPKLKSPCASAT